MKELIIKLLEVLSKIDATQAKLLAGGGPLEQKEYLRGQRDAYANCLKKLQDFQAESPPTSAKLVSGPDAKLMKPMAWG